MKTASGWVKVSWMTAALSAALAVSAVQASDSARHEAQAMEKAKIDSPRGAFTLSKSHNPVQTIYLREAKAGENRVIVAQGLRGLGSVRNLGLRALLDVAGFTGDSTPNARQRGA